MSKSKALKLRKFQYSKMQVFYEDELIGDIENDEEFIMFREDLIGNPEHNKYCLLTPKGTEIKISIYGTFEHVEEVEYQSKMLCSIIEKQMALRLNKKI